LFTLLEVAERLPDYLFKKNLGFRVIFLGICDLHRIKSAFTLARCCVVSADEASGIHLQFDCITQTIPATRKDTVDKKCFFDRSFYDALNTAPFRPVKPETEAAMDFIMEVL